MSASKTLFTRKQTINTIQHNTSTTKPKNKIKNYNKIRKQTIHLREEKNILYK